MHYRSSEWVSACICVQLSLLLVPKANSSISNHQSFVLLLSRFSVSNPGWVCHCYLSFASPLQSVPVYWLTHHFLGTHRLLFQNSLHSLMLPDYISFRLILTAWQVHLHLQSLILSHTSVKCASTQTKIWKSSSIKVFWLKRPNRLEWVHLDKTIKFKNYLHYITFVDNVVTVLRNGSATVGFIQMTADSPHTYYQINEK